jgi:hypothetical protein
MAAKSRLLAPRACAITVLTLSCPHVWALPVFLSDDQTLSLPSTGPVKHQRIRILNINDGAPSDALADPQRFPKLEDVGLSSHHNDQFLKELAANYPNIKALHISQSTILDNDSIMKLEKLPRLKSLSLNCAVSDPAMLSRCAQNLENLLLDPRSNLTTAAGILSFPNLRKLNIGGAPCFVSTFANMRAPNLQKLVLINTNLPSGWSKELDGFPHLNSVRIERAQIEAQDLESLKQRHIHVTVAGAR